MTKLNHLALGYSSKVVQVWRFWVTIPLVKSVFFMSYSVFVMLTFDDFKSKLLLRCFSSKKSIITWRSWPTTTSATTSARATTASSTTWRSWTCRSTGRDGAWPRPPWTLTTRRRRTRCQFYQHFMRSFCWQIFQKRKKDTDDITVFLCFWDLGSISSTF